MWDPYLVMRLPVWGGTELGIPMKKKRILLVLVLFNMLAIKPISSVLYTVLIIEMVGRR